MADPNDDPFKDEEFFLHLPADDPHFTVLGRIATAWAQFENTLDRAIWTIAAIDDETGACITSQLMSIAPRLKAYLALLHRKGMDDASLLKRLNKFVTDTEPITQKRNRAIHDAWFIGKKTKKVAQLRVTANRKLDYGFRAAELDQLKTLHDEIVDHGKRFSRLHAEARARLHLARQNLLD